MLRRVLLPGALLLSVASGCGKRENDVTNPSGSGSLEPVRVLSGRTEQPVPTLAGLTAIRGQTLTLQTPGFFTYRTAFAGSPILLWPADDGFLTSAHTRRMVYGDQDPGKLTRLPRGTSVVSLMPDAGIRAFPWALARVTRAAATLSSSHPALNFTVPAAGDPASGFPINIIVDFSDPIFGQRPDAAGAAYTYMDGSTIIRAKVVFRTLQVVGFWHTEDNFEIAVVHEVIHTTGLNHSSGTQDPPGIMSDSAISYTFRAPTELERLIMKMQYERMAGTTLAGVVESDPGAKTQASEPEWRVVCVIS